MRPVSPVDRATHVGAMRMMIAVPWLALFVTGLAACGALGGSDSSLLGGRKSGMTCSTNPHISNRWIDNTQGKSASDIFHDPTVAQVAEAARKGDTTRMRSLLRNGVDPRASGEFGVTLLDWSMRRQNPAAFRLLLDAGADPTARDVNHDNAMRGAVHNDDTTYLATLLAHGVDPNTAVRYGQTALMEAIMTGCDREFHMLLAAKGIDLSRRNESGETALFTAMITKGPVLELLNAGADPRAKDKLGHTFQTYLNMTPENVLSAEAKKEKEAILAWLRAHDVPLEQHAG